MADCKCDLGIGLACDEHHLEQLQVKLAIAIEALRNYVDIFGRQTCAGDALRLIAYDDGDCHRCIHCGTSGGVMVPIVQDHPSGEQWFAHKLCRAAAEERHLAAERQLLGEKPTRP